MNSDPSVPDCDLAWDRDVMAKDPSCLSPQERVGGYGSGIRVPIASQRLVQQRHKIVGV
eukprot:CAMPEP_0171408050 /NCGR_PEP_ID=MMETSP0880-20121228/21204_1 /TAXON_ID=67004 /ORGANISM="Thalassiosira weissflogii, Strain CCMP1336" /LENGTH=58 /DNA_ID=CAMNT_0011924165 /DNA_START=114 /DNA_END=290 /DNA_ORIENTATION=-